MTRIQVAALKNMPGAYIDAVPSDTAGNWSVCVNVPHFTFDHTTGEVKTELRAQWFNSYAKCVAALTGE